jgi:hypothetical protein
MNEVEQELIILNTSWEMIDGMVNWGMFTKPDKANPSNLLFQTSIHAHFFTVLLGDFLSEVRAFKKGGVPLGLKSVPHGVRPSDLTFLFHLRQVCTNPQFGPDAAELSSAVDVFSTWLEGEFIADGVNLNSIALVTDMKVARYRYLKMCGDIGKHNIARLETNVKHLQVMLENAGHQVTESQAYLAVDSFYEWFQDHIFIYHSSYIAEMLNNIRWAIYRYLRPEFMRSWHELDHSSERLPLYGYRIPPTVQQPVAEAMYWDAMNKVRKGVYVQQFRISDSFKELF